MLLEFPEGATPISDTSDLIIESVQSLNDLNRVEAENIFDAQKKYLREPREDISAWFNIKELQAILEPPAPKGAGFLIQRSL